MSYEFMYLVNILPFFISREGYKRYSMNLIYFFAIHATAIHERNTFFLEKVYDNSLFSVLSKLFRCSKSHFKAKTACLIN